MIPSVYVFNESARARNCLRELISAAPEFSFLGATGDFQALEGKARSGEAQVLMVSSAPEILTDWTILERWRKDYGIAVVLLCRSEAERHSLKIRGRVYGICEALCLPRSAAEGAEFVSRMVEILPAMRAIFARRPRQTKGLASTEPAAQGRTHETAFSLMQTSYEADLVAIGASTGRVEASTAILREFPADSPPTLLVQHIRGHFAEAHARALDRICACEVRAAKVGDRPAPGVVLVAPADQHMVLDRRGGQLIVGLDQGPEVNHHRPSVDRLFNSVAELGIRGAVGVLLTGMGNDGAAGLLAMHRAGMRTIAQDEGTSTVYGMPKAAMDLGAVQECLPLGLIHRYALWGKPEQKDIKQWH